MRAHKCFPFYFLSVARSLSVSHANNSTHFGLYIQIEVVDNNGMPLYAVWMMLWPMLNLMCSFDLLWRCTIFLRNYFGCRRCWCCCWWWWYFFTSLFLPACLSRSSSTFRTLRLREQVFTLAQEHHSNNTIIIIIIIWWWHDAWNVKEHFYFSK